jgi:hypothetical protein
MTDVVEQMREIGVPMPDPPVEEVGLVDGRMRFLVDWTFDELWEFVYEYAMSRKGYSKTPDWLRSILISLETVPAALYGTRGIVMISRYEQKKEGEDPTTVVSIHALSAGQVIKVR